MDLLKEISENRFVLVMLSEKEYEEKLTELVKSVEKKSAMICYVCLSRPYADVIRYLDEVNINFSKFFFIDVLTSHYRSPERAENCIFLKEPRKLNDIRAAIHESITKHSCSAVIFDTMSSLLMYEQSHDILKFTHELTVEESMQNTNKVFIILKEDMILNDSDSLIKDVEMFADRTINLENGKN